MEAALLANLANGTVFAGQFKIERLLSSGGMGSVYVAHQLATNKRRALKLMRSELVASDDLRRRFEQEAKVGSLIESDHVVEVIGAGVDEATGLPWLAMELLAGEDLEHFAQRCAPLGLAQVTAIFEQLCHALSAAHRRRIVHRDLKPENVFLASTRTPAAPFMVKVLDFGIAKVLSEATGRVTATLGTPMWMAPEQTQRGTGVSTATDVWPLGLIAFRLLAGVMYWRSASSTEVNAMMILREVVMDPLEAASIRVGELRGAPLPTGFDEWFSRCVNRVPTERFANADEAWLAFAALGSAAPGALRESTPDQVPSTLLSLSERGVDGTPRSAGTPSVVLGDTSPGMLPQSGPSPEHARSSAAEDGVWFDLFETERAALSAGRFEPARDRVRAALQVGGDQAAADLKRFARVVAKAGTDGPDPWQVEVVMRLAGVEATKGSGASVLLRAPPPGRGLAEPIPELRMLAIAHTLLSRAASGDVPFISAALRKQRATQHVAWWLTGQAVEGDTQAQDDWMERETRRRCERALAPFGLLTPRSLAERRKRMERTSGESTGPSNEDDPASAAFVSAWRDEQATLSHALDIAVRVARGNDSKAAAAVAASLGVLVDAPWTAEPTRVLALWCARSWAVAALGALPETDHRAASYRDHLARALVRRLGPTLADNPLSLLGQRESYVFGTAVSALVRERLDASAVNDVEEILGHASETGSLTRGSARHAARIVDLVATTQAVAPAARARLVRDFVMRLAATSLKRRQLSASQMWSQGLRQCAEPVEDPASKELILDWWAPDRRDLLVRPEDAFVITRALAGRELSSDDPGEARAWWANAAQSGLVSEGGPRVGRIPATLADDASALP